MFPEMLPIISFHIVSSMLCNLFDINIKKHTPFEKTTQQSKLLHPLKSVPSYHICSSTWLGEVHNLTLIFETGGLNPNS